MTSPMRTPFLSATPLRLFFLGRLPPLQSLFDFADLVKNRLRAKAAEARILFLSAPSEVPSQCGTKTFESMVCANNFSGPLAHS